MGEEAVLGANVVLTASTPIIDVTGDEPVEYARLRPAPLDRRARHTHARVPRGHVTPSRRAHHRQRTEATDRKVSLNDALRSYGVAV